MQFIINISYIGFFSSHGTLPLRIPCISKLKLLRHEIKLQCRKDAITAKTTKGYRVYRFQQSRTSKLIEEKKT